MQANFQFITRQAIKVSGFAAVLLLAGITSTFAYYPGGPWGAPYSHRFNHYGPALSNPYPYVPGFYNRSPYVANPWYRQFGFQKPWGRVNGGMAPDGSFWVNINIGGNYTDLQSLMAIMQMSGAFKMDMGGQSQLPLDFTQYKNNLWPM